MKKLFVTLVLILILLAVACTAEKSFPDNLSCEEIISTIQSVGEKPEYEKFYLKSKNNLDTLSMSLWADGLFEECAEFDLLEDYAIYLGAGTETYEVTVLKAKNEKEVEILEALIERRKQTLANGDKGMYDTSFETKMANSVLKTNGQFVIFLISNDNDAALKAIQKLMK